MKIIYMGTPDFAVGALEALIKAGHEIVLVVTQPDKQKGRGKEISFSPVKRYAVNNHLLVFQPTKIKEHESIEYLKKYDADIYIVAAFGQILSEEILNIPKYGCVNIHASLLPKYRGAAPIQWALIDGETETGVTIMQMDKGIDTGDMFRKAVVPIEDTDTGESLSDKLSAAGAELIVETLSMIENGQAKREKQDDSKSSYANMLKKELGRLDFDKPAEELERLIRGLNPWPSAYTYYKNKTLKIWASKVVKNKEIDCRAMKNGEVCYASDEEIYIKTGKDFLSIVELQLEGKKRMTTKEFLMGRKILSGEIFG